LLFSDEPIHSIRHSSTLNLNSATTSNHQHWQYQDNRHESSSIDFYLTIPIPPPFEMVKHVGWLRQTTPESQQEQVELQSNASRLTAECEKEANAHAMAAGTGTAALSLAANYILHRSSQWYRNRVEITGKAIVGISMVYAAAYWADHRASKQCALRLGLPATSHPSVLVKGTPTPTAGMQRPMPASTGTAAGGEAAAVASQRSMHG